MPRCSSSTMPAQFSLKQFSTDRKRRPDHRACEFSKESIVRAIILRNRPRRTRQDRFVGDGQGLNTTRNVLGLIDSRSSQLLTPETARSDSYLDWNVLSQPSSNG